LEWSL